MPRPRRTPGQTAVRLTAYVSAETINTLHDRADSSGVSIGALLDSIFGTQPTVEPPKEEPRTPLAEGEFRDHPGWKLNSKGQNVCLRCNQRKITHRNRSCI